VRIALVVDGRRWDSRALSRGARIRRRAYGVVAVCLALACCPVWPSLEVQFSDCYFDSEEWVVSWVTNGRTFHVRTPDRNAARIVDVVLWERGRK
jgi:hypothetical protein